MDILRRVCLCRKHYGCVIKNVYIFCEDCNKDGECEIPIRMELDETTGICPDCTRARIERRKK